MSRSKQHPIGRNVAKTKAKTDSVLSGTDFHDSRRGGYKAGSNRYQTSSKTADVRSIIRK